MGVLVLVPTILIVILSISDLNIFNIGPFTLNLDAFQIFEKEAVRIAVKNSIKFSLIATVVSFIIGYPIAYILANSNSKNKTLLVSLFIIPVWSNMLLRIMAWEILFFPESILNMFGISLDLIGTDLAIVIGMVSMYLPFMILPIYSVLEKIDKSLLDASKDLGANKITTFRKIVFPLSISGVVSGVIMTLLPAMTAFALPERLGGGKIKLIGNIVEEKFMTYGEYSAGSLISVLLMIIIVAMFIVTLRFDKEGEMLI
ncbi:Spermidine/putrescine transport system permease protein PotB [Candidatus Izimaplasma bacterium HR1]|jgi:spermidine/putrescine transport system permease protein|uniref:ABC transporter permease n=1 Tax=Candidatus Izimoplasma sp. HR1 TaxID=1541959 RepID=UPI0004F6E861|nr:Spermidine/putrescine transport system permease protein PotB [Candidatus Izimaplasma bacterium HR1]